MVACSPGNTEKLIFCSMSYMIWLPFLSVLRRPLRKKIMAPRGPRSDLCVVVVTTSDTSNGDGTMPAQHSTSENRSLEQTRSPPAWLSSAQRTRRARPGQSV